VLVLVLVFALASVVAPHPNSVSSSRITVTGSEVELALRCQARTLIEACPALDRDDDGVLEQAELDLGRATFEEYLLARLTIAADCAETIASGARVELELRAVRLVQDGRPDALRGALQGEPLVDFAFQGACAIAPRNLGIATMLFRESDPWHRDHAEIVWNGSAPVARLLWVEDPQWIFAPNGRTSGGALGAYVLLGVEHILTGYDHIAFVLVLIVASRRMRSLLIVVTTFTLAHSLTLASAAFGVLDLPASVVEPAIALSIAWVGLRTAFAVPPARMWPEAFGFGLIHGLGFAGSIAETLAAEPAKLTALLGFNLGVELGQLAIVVAAVLLLRAIQKSRSTDLAREPVEQRTLAPIFLRRATAGSVAVLGLFWFAQRVLR
jgi:hydrogenase/urease accessory protein HupE